MRLVQEKFPVGKRRFGVLINSHDDCLDVLVAPAFRGVNRLTSTSALIQGGLLALSSYHAIGSRITSTRPDTSKRGA